ncbi:MAG TPA: SRPBCC family protein [Chloroflexota bacterium]|nr:SRPBCC family protein [Chloroflexota bacterium]
MLAFENTIHVGRPVAEVFAFLADLENLPKWNYYVLDVRKRSNGPVGVGTTYHQVRKTDEQELCITELERNHTIVVRTMPPTSLSLTMHFALTEEGGTTCIRDAWTLDTGRPALLERLGAHGIQSAVAENLTKLKELLETGRVVLQDGRQALL